MFKMQLAEIIYFWYKGENMDAKNKKSLIGKASLDLSELASKQESTVERKLPIRSKGSVLSKEATLVVINLVN